MDADGHPLPETMNLNYFPAKLWHLVNNTAIEAISWDSRGESVVIDQHLFERQILSPGTINLDARVTFKTTNFSSFVRQLNLYGFRKVELENKSKERIRGRGAYCRFYNPNFKQNHPELVASLRRLTANIKAKATTARNGTPVPPQYLRRDHTVVFSPAVFAADKGTPGSSNHRAAGGASSSRAVHFQQDLLAPPPAAHQPLCSLSTGLPTALSKDNFSFEVFQCCQPVPLAAHLTFCPYTFYQEGGGRENKGYQEENKGDIYVDTIFQIADEVSPSPLSSCGLTTVTPENPHPVLVPSTVTCTLSDNPTGAVQAEPLDAGAESCCRKKAGTEGGGCNC